MQKTKRQMIIDGSTLFGVFLTLNALVLGIDKFLPWQKGVLVCCSLYFLVFALLEFLGIGYKKKKAKK